MTLRMIWELSILLLKKLTVRKVLDLNYEFMWRVIYPLAGFSRISQGAKYTLYDSVLDRYSKYITFFQGSRQEKEIIFDLGFGIVDWQQKLIKKLLYYNKKPFKSTKCGSSNSSYNFYSFHSQFFTISFKYHYLEKLVVFSS